MNTDLRKKQKMMFNFFKKNWWIMQFLEKLWKMWENKAILNVSQQKRHYLVSEQNYHTRKFFTENLLAIGMKKYRDNYE